MNRRGFKEASTKVVFVILGILAVFSLLKLKVTEPNNPIVFTIYCDDPNDFVKWVGPKGSILRYGGKLNTFQGESNETD